VEQIGACPFCQVLDHGVREVNARSNRNIRVICGDLRIRLHAHMLPLQHLDSDA
jgi:hypothetical protein